MATTMSTVHMLFYHMTVPLPHQGMESDSSLLVSGLAFWPTCNQKNAAAGMMHDFQGYIRKGYTQLLYVSLGCSLWEKPVTVQEV